MVRKPKLANPPVPRRFDLEQALYTASRKQVLVRLRYDDDLTDRLYQPTVVYKSTADKVLVSGVQITNPAMLLGHLEPHNFEIGRLRFVTMTNQPFVAVIPFNRFDPRHGKGIICSP